MLLFIIAKSGDAGEKIFSVVIIAIIFAIISTIYSKMKGNKYSKSLVKIHEQGGISVILSEVLAHLNNALGSLQIEEDATELVGKNDLFSLSLLLGGEHYNTVQVTITKGDKKMQMLCRLDESQHEIIDRIDKSLKKKKIIE